MQMVLRVERTMKRMTPMTSCDVALSVTMQSVPLALKLGLLGAHMLLRH